MHIRFFCLSLAFSLMIGNAIAQDQISLLNGRTFTAKVISGNDSLIKYEVWKKGKTKVYFMETNRIFDIEFADGTTEIYYKMDSLAGNFLTPQEMYHYVLGAQDAYKYHKGKDAFLTGFLIGTAGGALFGDIFLVIFVPFIPPSIISLTPTKIDLKRIPNPEYFSHETYKEGYKKVAKSKKVNNAVKGGVAGVITGIAAFYVAASLHK